MYFSHICYLSDSLADLAGGSGRKVYADKESVRQSEFYQAAAAGMKTEAMFLVNKSDYLGELYLAHEGKTYKITRPYERQTEITELICVLGRS
jgi:hypothetical protein